MSTDPRDNHIDYVEFPAPSPEAFAAVKRFYMEAFGWSFKDWGNRSLPLLWEAPQNGPRQAMPALPDGLARCPESKTADHNCNSMKPAAKFKADATFAITGRGLALAGEILEGTVKIGMKVDIPSWPVQLTISGVEGIRRADKQLANVGLLFASTDQAEIARWRALDLKDQVLEVQD